jgi:hypothetical protein
MWSFPGALSEPSREQQHSLQSNNHISMALSIDYENFIGK